MARTAVKTPLSEEARKERAKFFPEFDHLHLRYLKQIRRATGNPSPAVPCSYCPYKRFTNPLSSISFKILGSIRSLGLNFLISGRPLLS